MLQIIVFVMGIAFNQAPSASCETFGPRLDGVRVTVCNGSVVAYADASGNTNTVSDLK